jgi:hypothetical protein
MAFIFGLVLGIAVGIAIIVGFVKSENARSKRRSELATTVAAFARMTVEDSRKLLPKEFYPSWVVFTQRQKLNWLNSHLTKIWPYVNQAASELIKASVEPVLEQYTPIILSSIKLSKFTLGTVAPQFTGEFVSICLFHNSRLYLLAIIHLPYKDDQSNCTRSIFRNEYFSRHELLPYRETKKVL